MKSQSQKTSYYMIPFIWNVQNRQIHSDRKTISSCQGIGVVGRKSGMIINEYSFFAGWWNVPVRQCWWLHNFVKYTKTYWIVHLKGWILQYMDYISTKKMEKKMIIYILPLPNNNQHVFFFSPATYLVLSFSYSRAAADCCAGYNSVQKG